MILVQETGIAGTLLVSLLGANIFQADKNAVSNLVPSDTNLTSIVAEHGGTSTNYDSGSRDLDGDSINDPYVICDDGTVYAKTSRTINECAYPESWSNHYFQLGRLEEGRLIDRCFLKDLQKEISFERK
jgi:hypothetical protein